MTLKIDVMAAENVSLHHSNELHLKINLNAKQLF